jgi:uncharacterized protein YjbJ (UPF0337 family)
MEDDKQQNEATEPNEKSKGKISGFSQFIVGEIETIGGMLTGDPLTTAEGEFNVEVGTAREEIEEELEGSTAEKNKTPTE